MTEEQAFMEAARIERLGKAIRLPLEAELVRHCGDWEVTVVRGGNSTLIQTKVYEVLAAFGDGVSQAFEAGQTPRRKIALTVQLVKVGDVWTCPAGLPGNVSLDPVSGLLTWEEH